MTDEQPKDVTARVVVDEASEPFLFRGYTSADLRIDANLTGEGIDTGIVDFTECGLLHRPGKIVVVAGRQGDGKTTTMLHLLMLHVKAKAAGEVARPGPAVFLTYEEHLKDIYVRMLLWTIADSLERKINVPDRSVVWAWVEGKGEAWQDGAMRPVDPEDIRKIDAAAVQLDAWADAGLLSLVDGDGRDGAVDVMLSKFSNVDQTPSLLVVDYFQKIKPPLEGNGERRQEQLQDVSSELLQYCKGMNGEDRDLSRAVPMVIGAQVNRRSATAGTKPAQPELYDLRESDDLANDAACVLTVFRPGGKWVCSGDCKKTQQGKCTCEEPRWEAPPDTGTLSVKIVKNRDGQRDRMVYFDFYGAANYLGARGRTDWSTDAMLRRGAA